MKEPHLSQKKHPSQPPKEHTPDPFQPRPFAPVSEEQARDRTGGVAEPSLQTFSIQDPSGTHRHPIQPKLTIGAPGDRYEQEADRVASQVVQQIHSPNANAAPAVQREAAPEEEELQMKPELQRDAMPEEEELQMRPATEAVAGGPASESLESAISQARGSGQRLDPALQRQMGQAMGADFSGVTIHTDTQSDHLNRSIQAKAFTTGQDIFFRQGAYQPASRGGQELLAHELTHVVQQSGGLVSRSPVVQSGGATTLQRWPGGATKHLKDRASERGISEKQTEDAVKNGVQYDDPNYAGGTVYYDSSTRVVVCASSDGTKTTCYKSARPKRRWRAR